MHPELLNNTLFLRHYNRWLKQPDSIVFAAVAEFFISYNLLDEAIKVCRQGLGHQPRSVAGRLALAKALMRKGDAKGADAELVRVLEIVPNHTKALDLRVALEMGERNEERTPIVQAPAEAPEVEPTPEGESEEHAEVQPMHASEFEPEPEQEWDFAEDAPPDHADERITLPAWQTVTMAKIYSSQGHDEKARKIYQAILTRDPTNEAARSGLDSLGGGS